TTILRLRPLVRFDIAPSASPTTAIGTTIQFAQPRSGMKAGMAKIKAITPMTIDTKLSIALNVALHRGHGKSLSAHRRQRSSRLVAQGSCNAVQFGAVLTAKRRIPSG